MMIYRVFIKYRVLFPRILESLPPLPRQHSAAIGCAKNYQPIGVTVHSHCVESFEGLLQRCRRGRCCIELWKKHNFTWTTCMYKDNHANYLAVNYTDICEAYLYFSWQLSKPHLFNSLSTTRAECDILHSYNYCKLFANFTREVDRFIEYGLSSYGWDDAFFMIIPEKSNSYESLWLLITLLYRGLWNGESNVYYFHPSWA